MIATINSVIWAGATPVLVDVDEDLCMSYDKLTELTDIDAVIFVPLNGRTGDGEKIEKWCQKNEIILMGAACSWIKLFKKAAVLLEI